ncbi:MAG: hypothetical protein OSB57_13365, partial [Planctomycetota bacterium]|nr:hypothetical protein [Planctomycetota bacterium]
PDTEVEAAEEQEKKPEEAAPPDTEEEAARQKRLAKIKRKAALQKRNRDKVKKPPKEKAPLTVRELIRSQGGIDIRPEHYNDLRDVHDRQRLDEMRGIAEALESVDANARVAPVGKSPLVNAAGGFRGITESHRLLELLVEGGYFPGRELGDIHPQDIYDAIENNQMPEGEIQDFSAEEEAYKADRDRQAEEQLRELEDLTGRKYDTLEEAREAERRARGIAPEGEDWRAKEEDWQPSDEWGERDPNFASAGEKKDGDLPAQMPQEEGLFEKVEKKGKARAEKPKKGSKAQQYKLFDVGEKDDIEGQGTMFAAAYSGSGARFKKFSTEHIGSGEGNQAYGWGLYFATKKKIAEWYKKMMEVREGKGAVVVLPHSADARAIAGDAAETWDRRARRYSQTSLRKPKVGRLSVDDVLAQVETSLKNESLARGAPVSQSLTVLASSSAYNLQTWLPFGTTPGATVTPYQQTYERAVVFDVAAQLHRRGLLSITPSTSTSALYTVELAPEEDEYLLWDEPLSAQSREVQLGLEGSGAVSRGFHADVMAAQDITGAGVYRAMSNGFSKKEVDAGRVAHMLPGDSDKAASLVLHAAGIRGIKYLDGTSRGKGEGSYNYVIFDAADVEITDVRFASAVRHREEGKDGPVWDGTGPHGQMLTSDIMGILNAPHVRDFRDPRVVRAVLADMLKEFDYQMDQVRSGADWYEADIGEAFRLTSLVHPELRRGKYNRRMFTIMAGLISNGQKAERNWYDASHAYGVWKATGVIPRLKPTNNTLFGHQGNTIAKGMGVLDHIIQTKGLRGGIDWIMSMHTLQEIRSVRRGAARNKSLKWRGVRDHGMISEAPTMGVAGKLADVMTGSRIFGPKVGEFMLNLNGLGETTIDRWATRTWGRHFGRAFSGQLSKEGVHDAPTDVERASAQSLFEKIGSARDVNGKTAQAVLWFFEQQTHQAMGSRSAKSEYFSDGARRYAEEAGKRPGAGSRAGTRQTGSASRKRQGADQARKASKVSFAAAGQTNSAPFKKWFGDSKAVDADGKPLVVYRGFAKVPKPDGFRTRYNRATLSFTDNPSVASVYAASRDEKSFFPGAPQFNKGANAGAFYLSLKNPLHIGGLYRDDPRVNLADLFEEMGMLRNYGVLDVLSDLGEQWNDGMVQLVDSSENEIDSDDLQSAADRFEKHADRKEDKDGDATAGGYNALSELVVDAYVLADNPAFQAMAEELGHDGFTHVDVFQVGEQHMERLTGTSAETLEADGDGVPTHTTWRPFNQKQIKSATGNRGTFDATNPDTRYAAAGRAPELTEAAAAIKAGGGVTRAEYRDLVDRYKPVLPYRFVPDPATRSDMERALGAKASGIGKADDLEEGERVGLRLDIPAYTRHGVWVPTIHAGRGTAKVIGYSSVAAVTNAEFRMSEPAALKIAAGAKKSPFAMIRGDHKKVSPQEAKARAEEALSDPAWVQVGMDPERHGYFYDRKTHEKIDAAEEVIQVGPLVLAKNPTIGDLSDVRFAAAPPLYSQLERAVESLEGDSWTPLQLYVPASSAKTGGILTGIVGEAALVRAGLPEFFEAQVKAKNKRIAKADLLAWARKTGNADIVRAVTDLTRDSFRPGQLFVKSAAGGLLGKSVKAEEWMWSAMDEFFAEKKGQKKITKAELQEWIAAHKVRVEEVVLGDKLVPGRLYVFDTRNEGVLGDFATEEEAEAFIDSGANGQVKPSFLDFDTGEVMMGDGSGSTNSLPTKFGDGNLVEPGGENYREVLLRLPEKAAEAWEVLDPAEPRGREVVGSYSTHAEAQDHADSLTSFATVRRHKSPQSYTGGHYGEHPNVLAHVRFNDRTTADGKRVLFMEEVQSDWHQAGRKEGYARARQWVVSTEHGIKKFAGTESEARAFIEESDRDDLAAHIEAGIPVGVPDAPFKATWRTLAMKRMVQWAATNGYDYLAWTTGKMQVKRYESELRKVVDEIKWSSSQTVPSLIPDKFYALNLYGAVVGGPWDSLDEAPPSWGPGPLTKMGLGADLRGVKAVSATQGEDTAFHAKIDRRGVVVSGTSGAIGKPIEDVVGKAIAKQILESDSGSVKGDDLTIGGKGMEDFYDRMMPNDANKIGKPFGAKAGRL